ncbi:MAG TPA: AraC family transcriptional regulator [Fimbriimonadaceae bacterium]|nr:AraC family transcriptional regulator [Fimbriimonadaceae bacterium]
MPLVWSLPMGLPPMVFAIGVGGRREESHSFRLKGLWCLHLYRHEGELILDGHEFALKPEQASLIPPNTQFQHKWPHWPAVHLSVHFAPHGDYLQEPVPAVQSLDDRFERAYADLLEGSHWADQEQERLNSRVYDVLWRLVRPSESPELMRRAHPALSKAENLIRIRLADDFTVAELAAEVGLSHNHLIRLFKSEHGTTIQAFVRQQRAARALHLLIHSTMPIKAVAHEVGVGNLQQFNKLIKRELGRTPREIRSGGFEELEIGSQGNDWEEFI